MATTQRLIACDAFEDNVTNEIEITFQGQQRDGFLLMVGEKMLCYINSCPHTGATLNWNPNRFLDVNQEFI